MKKLFVLKNRPLAVTIVAFIFIIAGSVGIVYHASEYFEQSSISYELAWIFIVRVVAIVSGVLILRGSNAGRLLAILWLVYHVIIGWYHSVSQAAMHFILLAIISFVLFIPQSSAYFAARGRKEKEKMSDRNSEGKLI